MGTGVLADLDASYPHDFRDLCARMVHPDPDGRPTIADAAAALLHMRDRAWTVAPPVPPPVQPPVPVSLVTLHSAFPARVYWLPVCACAGSLCPSGASP